VPIAFSIVFKNKKNSLKARRTFAVYAIRRTVCAKANQLNMCYLNFYVLPANFSLHVMYLAERITIQYSATHTFNGVLISSRHPFNLPVVPSLKHRVLPAKCG